MNKYRIVPYGVDQWAIEEQKLNPLSSYLGHPTYMWSHKLVFGSQRNCELWIDERIKEVGAVAKHHSIPPREYP